MDHQSRGLLHVLLPDAVAIGIVLVVQFYYSHYKETFQSGFFCDDETLRYPLLKQTVPSPLLNSVAISSSVIAILAVELIRRNDDTTSYSIGPYKILQWQFTIYQMLVGFCFGALTNHLLTTVGKKSIGRLRPHFWYTCKPNITESCVGTAPYSYITDYVCQNANIDAIKDIRVSFPSGHSSFSFYCAIFIIIYLEARWKGSSLNYFKSSVQFIFLLAAWFTSLSRVMDNKHHWSDVLSGIILGSLVAMVNTIFVMRLFENSRTTKNSTADVANGEPINLRNETQMQF